MGGHVAVATHSPKRPAGVRAPPPASPAPMTGGATNLAGLLADGRELVRRLLALAPGATGVDWQRQRAARWRRGPFAAELTPIHSVDTIDLDDLLGIDEQKRRLIANTEQFMRGLPANNALLWGARGTGKSSLVHGLLNRYQDAGLRLVEVDKQALIDLAAVAAALEREPYRFLVVCDDLSFEEHDASYKNLKSALEGSVFAHAANMLIYATSNRRHLLPERMADNVAARHVDGELHDSDAVEEKISLSDRFGLWLSFHPFQQDEYLRVARHWIERLGREHGLCGEWDDVTRQAALRWAMTRGGRSGRTALHFAKDHIGGKLLTSSRPAKATR